MKKRYFCLAVLLCTCILGVTGCNKREEPKQDGPTLLWNGLYSDENQWYNNWRVAETEQGIYLTINAYAKDRVTLVYFDKASRKAIPLCNRADCNHGDLDCDSSLRGYNPNVYYYENMLYLIESSDEGTYLERMNPDGSNRERIRKLDNERHYFWTLIMHRGHFYYTGYDKLCELGFTEDKSEERVLVELHEDAQMNMNQLFAKGEYLYWTYAFWQGEGAERKGEAVAYRCHIPTGEVEELLCLPQGTPLYIVPLTDDDIYYYEVDKGLHCFHPSTKTSEVVYEESGRVGLDVYSGGKGLYVVNWLGLRANEKLEEIKVLADAKTVTNTFLSETPPGELSFMDEYYRGGDGFIFKWSNRELFYMDLTAEELSWESTGLLENKY